MVNTAVADVERVLAGAKGNDLLALYRYQSPDRPRYLARQPEEAETNLLAVVAEAVDLHALRAAFLPVWEEHGATLRHPPVIAPLRAFRRHLHLFPVFAYRLACCGAHLRGERLLAGEPAGPTLTEQSAYLAHQAMVSSAALAPELLPPAQAKVARAHLYKLACHLQGETIPDSLPASELFAQVQLALRARIQELPAWGEAIAQVVDSADAPNLEAVYQETDRTIFVLPELSGRRLREIDWKRLRERLQARYSSMRVTTRVQLQLIVQSEAALDFALSRYEHVWGQDPLRDLEVSRWAVWRNAGRLPSRLLIDDVPGAYLVAADEEMLHRVVHDYQNRLLNMRLQHELLHRFHGFAPAAPPDPLPGRETPLPQRVDAILSHLEWWAEHYYRQMEACSLDETLSAP